MKIATKHFPDAAQVAARFGEQLEPFILALVGVLIFVDQNVAEAVSIDVEHVGLGAEDDQHVEQQVAEVAGIQGLQALLVLRVELGAAAGGEGFGLAGVDLGGVQPRFFQRSMRPASWRAGQRFSSRLAAWISCLRTRSWSSVSRMVKLDCRPTSSAWPRSILAATEWKVPSHGMPSSAPPEIADALAHLARGLVGEGDGENLARPGFASGDQMGEARGQRRGLAGAGAGEDEDRPFGGQHGLALRRVQALQISGLRSRAGDSGTVRGRGRGTERQPTSAESAAFAEGSTVVPDIPVIHRLVTKFFASATRARSAWSSGDRDGGPGLLGRPARQEGRQVTKGPISAGRQW